MPSEEPTDTNAINITDADLDEEEDEDEPCKKCCKPATKPGVQKKKKAPAKVSPIVIKQRKEVVEKRIEQLEVRLARDKAIQQQYAESLAAAEAALAEAIAASQSVIADETTRDAIAV